MKKRILSAILCMAMVFPLFGGLQDASVVKAAGIDANDYCADVSEYRTGDKEDWTYPTKEGYVFAGWYTKKDFQQKYALTDEMVSGGAYAKFVDEDVFSIKYQMNKLANVADETMSLRMLTTVDDLTYQSVGFRFETGSVSQEYTTTTVYTSILANDQEVFPNVFSEESAYILGHSLDNIPYYHYSAQFTMTPIIVTLDGTMVEGVSRSMNIMDDYTVMGDQTFTYTGGGTDRWWDTGVKLYPGQWLVFDIEGLAKDISGQGVKLRCPSTGEAYGDSNNGRKNTCIPDTGKMRYFIQFNKAINGVQLACQLWADASLVGKELTYTNIRILNAPEDAYFYAEEETTANYVAPYFETLATSLKATAGRVLSYKVSMTNGSVANASVSLNDGATTLQADMLHDNVDGTQTVQFVLPENATNFKPSFELKDFTAGASNEIVIEEICILDAVDAIHTVETTDYYGGWLGIDFVATAGQKILFDIDTLVNLEVRVSEIKGGVEVSSHNLVSMNATQNGLQTIPYTIKKGCDKINIYFKPLDGATTYDVRCTNLMIVQ